MPRARRSAAAAHRPLPAAATRDSADRTSLRSLIEAKPFSPRTEASRKPGVGQLGKAFRAEAGSPRAPAGCSQARQRQCQHHGIWVFITTQRGRSRGATTFRTTEFPVPLRVKNTFLDLDVPEASPLVCIRSSKSGEVVSRTWSCPYWWGLSSRLAFSERPTCSLISSRKTTQPRLRLRGDFGTWADLLDDAAQTPPPPPAGSAGHELGDCKERMDASHASSCQPAARPAQWCRGCSLADECPFCHLCDSGEKRRRQKEKKVAFARRT
ncbi:unnamed protein product [Prorocentrum cordatum]|uniref:Uncharacterized protein n=1 Tax=Prorocentrum cordatum TaxID=2364126 RepID=A0ABN9VSJ1_9DINO|nr:unnamed protein product [Polarella glacialis]